jgi:hypothetical protein
MVGHILYQYYTRYAKKARAKTQYEYAQKPGQAKTTMKSDALAI